jgi:N-acetylmuramoyl-L-alanine amidase
VEDATLQRDIVRLLIDATYDMLYRVADDSSRSGVHVVDVRGCLPEVTDWADEIHATDEGFARVSDRFRTVLRGAGVG